MNEKEVIPGVVVWESDKEPIESVPAKPACEYDMLEAAMHFWRQYGLTGRAIHKEFPDVMWDDIPSLMEQIAAVKLGEADIPEKRFYLRSSWTVIDKLTGEELE